MNLYNLFEAPKRTPAPGTTGVMDNQVQSAASPIGSGTSRWESKKKPVTMMGVGNNGVVAEARDVQLDEISNRILGDYKKAAGADAAAADKAGDIERGNKRFKGIVKATIKQGDNDAKKHKEQGVAEGLPQTLRKVVPGYAKREIDKKMDAGKFGKTDADKDANFQRYKKIQDKIKEQGVAEGHADQQRRVFKKNGEPVGEVGIDRESSPGNGQWYMKYYPTGDDFGGYDSMEEAVADLKHLVNQFKAEGVAEGSNDNIATELSGIVAREDFDALYNLFSANTPAGRYVQELYQDISIDHHLHPDDDFEKIEELVFDRLADQFSNSGSLKEFASGGSGDSGNYFQALASAWYNGTFDSGSLQKGIKSQQDVERLLNRGIVCPDGKTRKLHIDYNSDFDGVEIYSDDYYNHGDESGELDSRTGQPWGPWDHMEFKDDELDESVAEATGDQKFDSMMSRMTAEPKYPDQDMPPTSIAELIQWADRNNKPYHEYFAQWARRNGFKNVNDALVWFGDNVDPSNPWGPKDFLDPFGRPAAEELEDAAKHDPKAAELMKVFRCYEEIVFDWPDEYRQMNMPTSRKGTDEGIAEAAKWRDSKYKGQLYTQEKPDYNDTREYDNAMWNPKPKGYPGRKELAGGSEYDRTDPLVKGYGRSGIKHNILDRGKRKGLPSRDQITSLKQSIRDVHGQHASPNLPESLGRATPKMPKPRDPGHAVLAAKRSSGAAGQHTNKKRQALLQPKHQKPLTRDMDLGEGWKSALGGAALAGAMALGAGGAQAQSTGDQYQPNMVAHVTFSVDGQKVTKDIDLGSQYSSASEAADAITNFLKSKGIKNFFLNIERVPNDQETKEDLDESIERRLMQMRHAGYDI